MAPLKPGPKQPTPRNYQITDTWSAHSTGHQVADNPYSNTTAWRDTRAEKLGRQFRTGDCLAGTSASSASRASANARTRTLTRSGAGAGAFDGTLGPDSDPDLESGETNLNLKLGHESAPSFRPPGGSRGGEYRWVSDAEAKRSEMGVRDIRSFMGVNKRKADADDKIHWTEKKLKWVNDEGRELQKREQQGEGIQATSTPTAWDGVSGDSDSKVSASTSTSTTTPKPEPNTEPPSNQSQSTTPNIDTLPHLPTGTTSKILTGTSIYINGTTLPQISDHKLKHLLVSHGANIATFMARKGVTHIIIAKPGTTGSGAGGGLAARKLQEEISRGGWKGVRIVGVEW